MSDDQIHDQTKPAEEPTEAKILGLVEDPTPDGPAGGDASAREYLETMGLLPYALEPVPVRPVVKSGLMDRISSTRAMPLAAPASVASFRPPSRAAWYLQIAALVVVAVGFLVFQAMGAARNRRVTAELEQLIETQRAERTELTEMRRLLSEKAEQLEMLTARGTEFCLLKPVGDQGDDSLATATMVISPDRRRWFLAAEGLAACADESCYDVWFLTETGPLHAASFQSAGAGSRIELAGGHHGLPTKLRGISITRAGEADAETRILFADQGMTIL